MTYSEKAHRAAAKAWIDEYRKKPCMDCGGTFPVECMDFYHLPQFKKSFGIMQQYANYRRQRILEEIDKCELVCANCHRIRTVARRRALTCGGD